MIPVSISPMPREAAPEVSQLMTSVISGLDYYSAEAKMTEVAKHTAVKLACMVDEDPLAVLVAVSGNFVGFCVSRKDDGVIWLAWFGVRPDFRGQGVGAALLDYLGKRRREEGFHKLWCDTRESNGPSQRVLLKSGFNKLCLIKDHWYRQDFYLWEKFLR